MSGRSGKPDSESSASSDSATCKVGCLEGMDLTIGNVLGEGAFAEVRAVYCHSRTRFMALKMIDRTNARGTCKAEIELLRVVSHPRIIAAHYILETAQKLYILMDLAANGDLADYIVKRDYIPEAEAHYIFAQITSGIQYLHSKGIAHRDIKGENILFDSEMDVKIADFGSGINVSRDSSRAACGTRAYAAPEVFTKKSARGGSYDAQKADCWSMGVTLFAMVCGELVFGENGKPIEDIFGEYSIQFRRGLQLNRNLKDFIRKLLRKDPSCRLSSQEMGKEAWMAMSLSLKPSQMYASKFKFVKSSSSSSSIGHRTSSSIGHRTSSITTTSSSSSACMNDCSISTVSSSLSGNDLAATACSNGVDTAAMDCETSPV